MTMMSLQISVIVVAVVVDTLSVRDVRPGCGTMQQWRVTTIFPPVVRGLHKWVYVDQFMLFYNLLWLSQLVFMKSLRSDAIFRTYIFGTLSKNVVFEIYWNPDNRLF